MKSVGRERRGQNSLYPYGCTKIHGGFERGSLWVMGSILISSLKSSRWSWLKHMIRALSLRRVKRSALFFIIWGTLFISLWRTSSFSPAEQKEIEQLWNWHKTCRRYVPSADLNRFPKGVILNVELVDYWTRTVKGLVIIYSNLPLIGGTWGALRNLLESFYHGDHVKLSKIFKADFWEHFQEADSNIIEGIIFKEVGRKLVFSTLPIKNTPFKERSMYRKMNVNCGSS